MSNASESGRQGFAASTRSELAAQLRELQDERDRQVYQQNAAAACIELLHAEVEKLESLTLGSFMASIMGTKPAKLDALRVQMETIQAEQAMCAQAVTDLHQQIADLDAQLAGMPDEQLVTEDDASAAATANSELEHAIDEGESLLNNLTGMSRACGRLRHGHSAFDVGGALLAAASYTTRRRAANTLTAQIADCAARFHATLGKLRLDPAVGEDAEILAAAAQLERFADPGILGSDPNNWVELEVLAGSLVADLHERLKRG